MQEQGLPCPRARRRNDLSLATGAGDKSLRRNVLVSIVRRFRKEGAIPEGMVGKNYFSAQFTLKMKDGDGGIKELLPSYTLFNAEVFTKSVSQLETQKHAIVKNIFTVSPRSGRGNRKN